MAISFKASGCHFYADYTVNSFPDGTSYHTIDIQNCWFTDVQVGTSSGFTQSSAPAGNPIVFKFNNNEIYRSLIKFDGYLGGYFTATYTYPSYTYEMTGNVIYGTSTLSGITLLQTPPISWGRITLNAPFSIAAGNVGNIQVGPGYSIENIVGDITSTCNFTNWDWEANGDIVNGAPKSYWSIFKDWTGGFGGAWVFPKEIIWSGCNLTFSDATLSLTNNCRLENCTFTFNNLGQSASLNTTDNTKFQLIGCVFNGYQLAGSYSSAEIRNCEWQNMAGAAKDIDNVIRFRSAIIDNCKHDNGIDFIMDGYGADPNTKWRNAPGYVVIRNYDRIPGRHYIATGLGTAQTQQTFTKSGGWAWKYTPANNMNNYEEVDRIPLISLAVKENQPFVLRVWVYIQWVKESVGSNLYANEMESFIYLKAEAGQLVGTTTTNPAFRVGSTQTPTTPQWELLSISYTPQVTGVMDFYLTFFNNAQTNYSTNYYWDDLSVRET